MLNTEKVAQEYWMLEAFWRQGCYIRCLHGYLWPPCVTILNNAQYCALIILHYCTLDCAKIWLILHGRACNMRMTRCECNTWCNASTQNTILKYNAYNMTRLIVAPTLCVCPDIKISTSNCLWTCSCSKQSYIKRTHTMTPQNYGIRTHLKLKHGNQKQKMYCNCTLWLYSH